MNVKEFLQSEIIGMKMEVINSKNKNLIGIKGDIVDETKHTLTIKDNEKIRILLKKQITLKIYDQTNEIKIKGELLVGRPEDRLKKWKKIQKT